MWLVVVGGGEIDKGVTDIFGQNIAVSSVPIPLDSALHSPLDRRSASENAPQHADENGM